MKRIFSFAIILVMLLSLAACNGTLNVVTDPTEAPATDAPATEAPATEDPVKVTPEPTEAPTPAPVEPLTEAYFKELHSDEPLLVDLDCDGADDTVLAELVDKNVNGFREFYLIMTITLAADPEAPFVQEIERCDMFSGFVADFDLEDGRREIVLSFDEESDDFVTYVWRVNESGGIDTFEAGMMAGVAEYFFDGYPEDYPFDPAEGFPCWVRTEILGTFDVEGRFTVTADGIKDISEMYAYPENHNEDLYGSITLIRELTLTKLDENLNEVEEVTLPVGTVIFQMYTDRETMVIVATEDGTLYKASVEIVDNDDEWGIYINGVRQDELGFIPYAD